MPQKSGRKLPSDRNNNETIHRISEDDNLEGNKRRRTEVATIDNICNIETENRDNINGDDDNSDNDNDLSLLEDLEQHFNNHVPIIQHHSSEDSEFKNKPSNDTSSLVISPNNQIVDLESEALLQQVIEIQDDEDEDETNIKTTIQDNKPVKYKSAAQYICPICFDPPYAALVTLCGHVFCTECLFHMINSSRSYKKCGQCALCRKDIKLKDVRMVILKMKRVLKDV